jgi:hypothetical protein
MKRLFDWVVIVTFESGSKSFTFPTKEAAERFAQRTQAEGREAIIQRVKNDR